MFGGLFWHLNLFYDGDVLYAIVINRTVVPEGGYILL